MTLHLPRHIHDTIVAHAQADHPDEACGIITAPTGTDRPSRIIPMANADRSPTRYQFDPAEQLRMWQEVEDQGEWPAVIYHSHPATAAYPSAADIAYATEPGHYLIIGLSGPAPELRSYRITDGQAVEEPVLIVQAADG